MCMVCPELSSESAEGKNRPWEKDPHQYGSSGSLALLSVHSLQLHTNIGCQSPLSLSRGPWVSQTGDGEAVVRHWGSSTQGAKPGISESGSSAEALDHCSGSQDGSFGFVGQTQPVDAHPHPLELCAEVSSQI